MSYSLTIAYCLCLHKYNSRTHLQKKFYINWNAVHTLRFLLNFIDIVVSSSDGNNVRSLNARNCFEHTIKFFDKKKSQIAKVVCVS